MTPLFSSLDSTDFLIIGLTCFGFYTYNSIAASRQSANMRRVERKLDVLLKHHGIELPSGMSADVQQLAKDPANKIAAIKLHRDDHLGLSLAEAKAQVEDFIQSPR